MPEPWLRSLDLHCLRGSCCHQSVRLVTILLRYVHHKDAGLRIKWVQALAGYNVLGALERHFPLRVSLLTHVHNRVLANCLGNLMKW